MFALVGQVERAFQGREAFQEIDQVATHRRPGQMGGRAAPRRGRPGRDGARPSARRCPAVPGRCSCRCRRTCSTRWCCSSGPDADRPTVPRAAPTRSWRAVIELLAAPERPVILAGGGVLRARTSTELLRFAELLQVPVIAAWRRADVISNDHPLYLGHGRASAPRRRSATARHRRRPPRHRLAPERGDHATATRCPRDGIRLGARRPRARTCRRARRRPRSASRRTRRPSSRRPTSGSSAAPSSTRSASPPATPTTREDRAAWEAAIDRRRHPVGRAGRPSRAAIVSDAPPGPRRRRDPDHRRRQLRRLGRPRLPVPAARHVPRPDVGRDGLRPAGRDRGRARPSRSPGRRARRRRRPGDDDGRARDGGPRRRPGRRRRASTTSATARSGCGRSGAARASGVATELGPVDFAAIARACGARGVRVERDAEFEPALRAALAADRPTVIQLALDRRWVSVDEPPARVTRPTFHLVPERDRGRRGATSPTATPTRRPRSRPRASSTAPTGSTRSARPSTATTPRIREPFLALTVDLDALDVPWRYDVAGSPYPHIYGRDPARGDRRRSSRVDREPGRPVRRAAPA